MKLLITNNNKLLDADITEIVKRVKALIINSKDEILLGYSHNTYQFPGGHVEFGENLAETLERELLEEVGMNLCASNLNPFACAIGYYKDWPSKGQNRKTEIYYYEIRTDEKPNLANTKYTENEKNGNFQLRYVPLIEFEKVLIQNAKDHGNKNGIAKEMIDLFKIYKNSKHKK